MFLRYTLHLRFNFFSCFYLNRLSIFLFLIINFKNLAGNDKSLEKQKEAMFVAIEKKSVDALDALLSMKDFNPYEPYKKKYRSGSKKILVAIPLLQLMNESGWLYGYKEVFKKIRSQGFKINQIDKQGKTILMNAAECGFFPILFYILEQDSPQDPIDLFKTYRKPYAYSHQSLKYTGIDSSLDPIDLLKNYQSSVYGTFQYTALDAAFNFSSSAYQSPLVTRKKGRDHGKIILELSERMFKKICRKRSPKELRKLMIGNYIRNIWSPKISTEYKLFVSSKNGFSYTPAAWVAALGWMEGLKVLLENVAIEKPQDKNDNNLLMIASLAGKENIVKYLLEYKPNLDLKKVNKNGENALLLSIKGVKSAKIVKYLIKAEPSLITQVDHDQRDAISHAVEQEEGEIEILDILLKIGQLESSYLNRKSKNQESSPLIKATLSGYLKVVKLLIDYGADPTLPDINSITPLMYAAYHKQTQVLIYLLSLPPYQVQEKIMNQPRLKNNAKQEESFDKKILSSFFSEDSPINKKSKSGKTAMMFAAAENKGYKKIIEILLKAGADPTILDENGWNLTMHAAYYGHSDIIELILPLTSKNLEHKSDQSYTALMYAVINNKDLSVKSLLKHNADPNTIDEKEWNALHYAARYGHQKILFTLLSNDHNKYKVDINAKTNLGRTPLMLAARWGHIKVFKELYRAKADIKETDHKGLNILMHAAAKGQEKIIEYIVDELHNQGKIDINQQAKDGKTALIYATKSQSLKAVKMLCAAGADPTIKDKNSNDKMKGWPPLLYAANQNSQNIVKFLAKKFIEFDSIQDQKEVTLDLIKKLTKQQDEDKERISTKKVLLDVHIEKENGLLDNLKIKKSSPKPFKIPEKREKNMKLNATQILLGTFLLPAPVIYVASSFFSKKKKKKKSKKNQKKFINRKIIQ